MSDETKEKEPTGFDTNKPFKVTILSGTEKSCELRFPTDKEWCDRSRKLRVIRRELGRGKSQRQVTHPETVDYDLFAALVSGAAENFDGYEATAIISRLAKAEVVDIEREGNNFRIELDVFGGVSVIHTLKMPTKAQVVEYGRASIKETDGKRFTAYSVALEPSADTWKDLKVDVTGYAEGSQIPLAHKDVAVVALFDKLQEIESPEV